MDLAKDQLLTLQQAAELFPGVGRSTLSYETIRRWATSGVRGVRLETYKVGGRRFTTTPALNRFVAALTKMDRGDGVPTAEERRARYEQVREALAREFGV